MFLVLCYIILKDIRKWQDDFKTSIVFRRQFSRLQSGFSTQSANILFRMAFSTLNLVFKSKIRLL
jgi:hypothetical protein